MGQLNPSGLRPEENPSNANGRRIIQKAASYLGTVESPALSDTGVDIDRWNDFFSANAIPWAGSFVTGMYHEADVRDDGIGDPDPQVMWQRAVSGKRISPSPFPGCIVVWGVFADGIMTSGITADIFVRWEDREQAWTFVTIGGNIDIGDPVTNQGVQIQVRNGWLPDPLDLTKQYRFIVPKAISLREAKAPGTY